MIGIQGGVICRWNNGSILSDNIVYVKSEDSDIMNGINIKPIDYREYKRMYKKMGKEGGEWLDIDFGESPRDYEK